MSGLAEVLRAFHRVAGCGVMVVAEARRDGPLTVAAAAPPEWQTPPFDPRSDDGKPRDSAPVPGPVRAWILLDRCRSREEAARHLDFLVPIVSQQMQASLEVEHAATELAERYEEINLLYTISEILGRTVNLEEASATILKEVSETVGARKAAILVHDRVTDTLAPVALLGAPLAAATPISVGDEASISAGVFRSQRGTIAEADQPVSAAEAPYRKGMLLSVPIMWTGPQGPEPLGVVNLSDRRSGQPFTAGDQKLITAIATQIATAIQNARLVRHSIAQQRLLQEMQLAHDLQMKLLPDVTSVAPAATVAARVIPAESVGGDFYHLFRLGESRSGIMIGDVSSHGYRAALIMALTMSASAIHAQATTDPGELVNRLRTSLQDELASTEMYITLFYGVVDPDGKALRYTNMGHPHAFQVGADGTVRRLEATHPPLGMHETAMRTMSRPWVPKKDLLVLFTDGISDARDRAGARLGEQTVLDLIAKHRKDDPARLVDRVFDLVERHSRRAPRRDDLTLVVLRS